MALIVEAKNPGMRCSILLVDARQECVTVGAGPSLPPEYNAAVEGLRIGPAVGSCGTAAFWNVPVVVEDIASDTLWAELRDAAALAGVLACWSHPITSTTGDVLGAMALYSTEPSAPARHQMDGLEIAARMVGLAVERERLEEQLRETAKTEAITVLAGGIAHDFNNLLAAVLGNAELALMTLPPGAEAAALLQKIVTASVSAHDLCNQMLAYAGRGSSSTETLECNAMARELGGLLAVTLSKKATLEYDLHDGPLGVLADRSQLGQVVMNLIRNASEAVGDHAGRVVIGSTTVTCGGAEPQATHSNAALEPGEYVRLWVHDTGPGMTAETRARIFDPFFTTKTTGRGLGLAAVQGIVRAHDGAIDVESTEGVGTTVSVLLPRVPLPLDGAPATAEGTVARSARLLLVDDEPAVRAVLADVLESAGYGVLLARDGQEALDVFREQPDSIDCVLLDLSMPKLGGDEVFHELRKLRPDVRVILSSGFSEQEMLDRFQGAGLAGVLQKPARMHVLLAKVADALNPLPAYPL